MAVSTRYNYVKSRFLENSLGRGPQYGCWMTTYCRTQFGWGEVSEADYPSDVEDEEYFAPIPPAIDKKAKPGRTHHYLRVRDSRDARTIARANPDYLGYIKNGIPFPRDIKHLELKVGVEYTQQFLNADYGRIEIPDSTEPVLGSHSMPIIGISEPNRCFVVANSWIGWGYHTIGDMPFEFFDRFMIESWAVDESKLDLKPGSGSITTNTWSVPHPVEGTVHGIEIYDPAEDERIAWSFIVQRGSVMDLEEFFVKPEFRQQGFGGRLAYKVRELAETKGCPLRAWIPYPDASEENREALRAALAMLGLSVRRSGTRWAAYKAVPGDPVDFPFVRIPEPPGDTAETKSDETVIGNLRGLITKYEDPFGPAVSPDEWEAVCDSD